MIDARIIAATGHRPAKLGGYTPGVLHRLTDFAAWWLETRCAESAISGVAQGWDTAFALACIRLGIPLTAAVPFVAQPNRWPVDDVKRYHAILAQCHRVVIVSPGGYSDMAMQLRNKWMVDQCTHLCALWNGSPGGTANCLHYADSVNRPYSNPWHFWLQWQRACNSPGPSLTLSSTTATHEVTGNE